MADCTTYSPFTGSIQLDPIDTNLDFRATAQITYPDSSVAILSDFKHGVTGTFDIDIATASEAMLWYEPNVRDTGIVVCSAEAPPFTYTARLKVFLSFGGIFSLVNTVDVSIPGKQIKTFFLRDLLPAQYRDGTWTAKIEVNNLSGACGTQGSIACIISSWDFQHAFKGVDAVNHYCS